MSLIKLTVKGEAVIASTIDEWGNRVVSGVITEYGDTVYTESRMFSDTLTIGDVRVSGVSKIIANGVGVLDTFSRIIVISKILTEIADISDVVSKSMSRALSDVVSIDDTLILLMKRILSEVISVADTLGSFTIVKIISNSFTGLVDSITRGNVKTPILETVNVDDVIEKGVVRRSFDEVMSIVDTIIVTPIKSCIESIGVTDALGAFSISKLVSNTINIIDSRISSMTKTPIEEVVSTDDSISNVIIVFRTFAESITTTDTISDIRRFLYERRSKIVNKLLQSSVINKLLRSKVEGIKNSEAEQYED